MIEDTKWVKSLVEKPGGRAGKFHVVTWNDGKKDNLFEPALVEVCKQAMANQLAVHYFKESNIRESDSKTFWNIVSAETVALEEMADDVRALEPQEPIPQELQPDEIAPDEYPFEKPPKFSIDARQHDIHKQVALYCAVRLTCHGLMELSKLKQNTEMLLKYLDGE